jgi:hypothetical protein
VEGERRKVEGHGGEDREGSKHRTEKERRREEWTKNMKGEVSKNENEMLKERIKVLEYKIKEGVQYLGKEDREAHVRIDKLEPKMAKDRTERQEYEWDMKEDMEIQDTKDYEKDMERKLEGAMEQMKILNLEFGSVCVDRKKLVREVISQIKEIIGNDRLEFDRIMKGTTVVLIFWEKAQL